MKALALAVAVSMMGNIAYGQGTTVETCHGPQFFSEVPTRVVTLNQPATEVMLALGLGDVIVATAGQDNAIPEAYSDEYGDILVLADGYPTRDVLLGAKPDFLFGSFESAFYPNVPGTANNMNFEEAFGYWNKMNIGTYISDISCASFYDRASPPGLDPIFVDIEKIGKLFQVEDRAKQLERQLRARLEVAASLHGADGQTALYYDFNQGGSSGLDSPTFAGCCGGPAELMRAVGLSSVTDQLEGQWADGSWDAVVIADPDVILLTDAEWSTAADKRAQIEADPRLSSMRAVMNGSFVTVPFTESFLSISFVDGVENVARQLAELSAERTVEPIQPVAADLDSGELTDPAFGCTLRLTGQIERGDAQELEATLQNIVADLDNYPSPDIETQIVLCMNSLGGDYLEGIKLANIIYDYSVTTQILPTEHCLSACALAFMGGNLDTRSGEGWIPSRYMHSTSVLGFHSPRLDLSGGEFTQEDVERSYAAAILAIGVLNNDSDKLRIHPRLIAEAIKYIGDNFYYINTIDQIAVYKIRLYGYSAPTRDAEAIRNACLNTWRWQFFPQGNEPDFLSYDSGALGNLRGNVLEWYPFDGSVFCRHEVVALGGGDIDRVVQSELSNFSSPLVTYSSASWMRLPGPSPLTDLEWGRQRDFR